MKKKIEEIKEAIYNCSDEYAENREQVRRAINLLEELEKQFSLNDVVASLICVDREKLLRLTVGKKYPLIKEHENGYEIINDNGHKNIYMKHCFKKL